MLSLEMPCFALVMFRSISSIVNEPYSPTFTAFFVLQTRFSVPLPFSVTLAFALPLITADSAYAVLVPSPPSSVGSPYISALFNAASVSVFTLPASAVIVTVLDEFFFTVIGAVNADVSVNPSSSSTAGDVASFLTAIAMLSLSPANTNVPPLFLIST